jgi:heptosyltransferase I
VVLSFCRWFLKGTCMGTQKILIIKMTAIGDVVIALPHIDVIRSYHENDRVWLLTSAMSQNVVANHPYLNVSLFERNRNFGKNGFWRTLWWIRKQKFARIYDLQGNRISRLFTRFSSSPVRVGNHPGSVYNRHPENRWVRTTHQNIFDRLNETLVSAGLPCAEKKAHIYLEDDDIAKVDQWKKIRKLEDKKYVVMHAGSSSDRPAKRWPVENYLKIAEMIEAQGLNCIWIGSDPEIEINAYLSAQAGIDSTGMFTLRQVYALARKALFAVSSDSCPMHIFAAAGIPVYCFFGPENWRWSHPLGQRDRVLRNDVDCSPCFQGVCPEEKGHACLEGVSPALVFDKIDTELKLTQQ